MTYLQFLKLSYKKFKRSPQFSKQLALKIFAIIGYFFLALYAFGAVLLLYFGLKEQQPHADIFRLANQYLFVYFFIVFYVMMYISFDTMQVKAFMILPVSKKKIVKYHLSSVFLQPVNLIFLLMIALFIILVSQDNPGHFKLIVWGIGILATTFIIELLLFLSSRNNFLNAVMGLSVFVIIYKMQWLSTHLGFIGEAFYKIYEQPAWVLIPLITLFLIYSGLYRYILNRFYLDDAIKGHQKNEVKELNLSWTQKFGLIGNLIANDLRLIWRNARPRQSLFGFVVFYAMAFVLFSKIGDQFQQPEFNKILFLMMLTGYFVMQFGNFVPAWDSEYYRLLMTQGISYKTYLESKWWLLTASVLITAVLALPFLILGWQVYVLLLAMAIFNIGFNIPATLLSGAYRTTPIKLNEKVKAFQSRDSFNFKTFVFGILRLLLPIVIYMLLNKYAGFYYGIGFLAGLGLLGLLLKKQFIHWLTQAYQKRKYITLEAFVKNEA